MDRLAFLLPRDLAHDALLDQIIDMPGHLRRLATAPDEQPQFPIQGKGVAGQVRAGDQYIAILLDS